MEGSRLLAGAAQVDITPKMGTHLEGDLGRSRPAEILVDPLFAKALNICASSGETGLPSSLRLATQRTTSTNSCVTACKIDPRIGVIGVQK